MGRRSISSTASPPTSAASTGWICKRHPALGRCRGSEQPCRAAAVRPTAQQLLPTAQQVGQHHMLYQPGTTRPPLDKADRTNVPHPPPPQGTGRSAGGQPRNTPPMATCTRASPQ
eukprot:122333_1